MDAGRSTRGKLKIFFGYAPGVGKTYAMLEAGRKHLREGQDLAIGWLNTRGRREIAALAEGLERIPPKELEHRGVFLKELDLEAALSRAPRLLLIDELAHTNAPGSRHQKRCDDVRDLLQAGIDVFTTLNVQHVESLSEVVGQITGFAMTETVPDAIFDQAQEIELVDIAPDDLLDRLKQGKIYLPEDAERAMEHFFQKGRLIALRELALRRAAERVDAQAVEWKKEQGLSQSWPLKERVMVAISGAPQAGGVVREAYRMAAALKAPLLAVLVETPGFDVLAKEVQERASAHLELARGLGAETLVVTGERVSDALLDVARSRQITRIVVGRPTHARWRDRFFGSLVEALVRGAQGIEVVVARTREDDPTQGVTLRSESGASPRQYVAAVLGVLFATVICSVGRSVFALADQAMLHLLAVLILASRLPRGPSILAAVAAVASLDFFFVEPLYTFMVGDFRYIVTFLVMLLVGLVVSSQTLRIREQAEAARRRAHRATALYAMGRDFAVHTSLEAIAATAVEQVSGVFAVDAELLFAAPGEALRSLAHVGRPVVPSDRELAVARWTFDHGEAGGFGTRTLPGSDALYLPLAGPRVSGVLAVRLRGRPELLSLAEQQLLRTFAAQAALALERARLSEVATSARLSVETERTRSALLSAVSHDLRTPLATIGGSAEALLDDQIDLSLADRRALLESIRDEAQRLSRLTTGLLELTRLESAGVTKEWVPIEEVVDSTLESLARRIDTSRVLLRFPEEVLWVHADASLLQSALYNLLENALKYSPSGSCVEVAATGDEAAIEVRVSDRGPGVPAHESQKIFERFYRAADGRRVPGTGLGLTVARAIAEAHGGTIGVEAREGGGSCFRLSLPLLERRPGEEARGETEDRSTG